MFDYEMAFILAPIAAMIVGALLLWSQGQVRPNANGASEDVVPSVLSALGWTLLIVGIFALVGVITNVFFIPAWIVLAAVLLSIVYRYRSAERRALLWTLMLAAERGIPLDTAARAFGEERSDFMGRRVLDLAEYLEAGLPLTLALKRSGIRIPQAVALSAELGQQTGDLGGALRRSLGYGSDSELVFRSAAEKGFYLLFVLFFGLVILTFMMVKIITSLHRILDEFSVDPPVATRFLYDLANVLGPIWPLVLLAAAGLMVPLLQMLSYYTGVSSRYLPGIASSWRRADRGIIMHWLAHAVRQSRPLSEMLRLVAGYVVQGRLRRRLHRSAKRIDQGLDWTDCLESAGVIRRSEATVFRAAERTGNLAWALDEMADGNTRRAAYQLLAWINIAFPLALLVMGALVLFVASSVFDPLFKMIGGV